MFAFNSSTTSSGRSSSRETRYGMTAGLAVCHPQMPTNHLEEKVGVDRLRDIVRGAGFHRTLAIFAHRLRGEGDDRKLLASFQGPHLARGFITVHFGHH